MDNEKIDSILNLSLQTEEEIREKSDILSNGFNPQNKTWEIIVKYHGDIGWMEAMVESLELLLNGYAIMTVTQDQLERLIGEEQIEYVEKPKSFAFDIYQAKQNSCILPVTVGGLQLSGAGVLIAVLDSGINYMLRDFRDESGSRILYLWDQTAQANEEEGFLPPSGFRQGVEFTKEQLDRTVLGDGRVLPTKDISGHGTAVAGIAAGSSLTPLYRGIAPESKLLIVKLGGNQRSRNLEQEEPESGLQNFPLTTDLMRGITYVLLKARELKMPVVINMSIGDTYGSHDGSSLLERFIDAACETGRNAICIGSGNEAVSGGHTSLRLFKEENVELSVAPMEKNINVQLWKNYADTIRLELVSPQGVRFQVSLENVGKQTWITGNTRVLIYVSPPTPYSVNQEIFFDFIPLDEYIDSGIWNIRLRPVGESREDLHFFLPNATVRNIDTRFLRPNPYLTMTIPAFASRAITVAAYDSVLNAYADFSGRDREIDEKERVFFASNVKPDISAPGVDIMAPATDGRYRSVTGTSFATPIVSGSVALLMEWGIVRGNDPFLYGEKVKAYLRRGAKSILGENRYPNEKTGYGALCVADSIPGR